MNEAKEESWDQQYRTIHLPQELVLLFKKQDKNSFETTQIFLACVDLCYQDESLKLELKPSLEELTKKLYFLVDDVLREKYQNHLSKNKIANLIHENHAIITEFIAKIAQRTKVLENDGGDNLP